MGMNLQDLLAFGWPAYLLCGSIYLVALSLMWPLLSFFRKKLAERERPVPTYAFVIVVLILSLLLTMLMALGLLQLMLGMYR